MRWVQSEYLLKGIFLGLVLFVALDSQSWAQTGQVGLYMASGFGIGLVLAFLRQMRDFPSLLHRPHAFFLFVLLENPLLIYSGVVLGLALGAFDALGPSEVFRTRLMGCLIGGLLFGIGFEQLRVIHEWRYKLAAIIGAGGVLIWLLDRWLGPDLGSEEHRQFLAYQLLLGLPFFYLLTFVGMAEESEAEMGGMCIVAALAIHWYNLPESETAIVLLVPAALFFLYITYALPRLRIFKYVVRGYSYGQSKRYAAGLRAFRRAVELGPKNNLARQGNAWLHALILRMPIERIDPNTIDALDAAHCLQRATALLIGPQPPTADEVRQALDMLNLVEAKEPRSLAQLHYLRAVAAVHLGDLDKACALLNDLLDPAGWFPTDTYRRAILYDAWQLVLLVHPRLKERVGEPQLALPGRRMEAIDAAERQIVRTPDEQAVQGLRNHLIDGLTEDEFSASLDRQPPLLFPYLYAEQRALQLFTDPAAWERSAALLRMTAHGQPLRRPGIYLKLADGYARAGQEDEALRYLEKSRDSGLEMGVDKLPSDQQEFFYASVKRLGDEAARRNNPDEAIYDYTLYTRSDRSGKETYRSLAEQYERKKETVPALRMTEAALRYGSDADLVARKDRYYYSLSPEELLKVKQEVAPYFDTTYCIQKARQILDAPHAELEALEWADHLIAQALVMQPGSIAARLMAARCQLRRGLRQEGLQKLEDIREMTPSGGEETDAWYYAIRQLSKLYLDEYQRPDYAVECLLKYKESLRSGADTLWDLGRAYEALGDHDKALACYKQVAAYEKHPLRWEAESAIRRLTEPPSA